jgi:UbiD family decarboxylase
VTGSEGLREWIQAVEARGELTRIAGADPASEIGPIVSSVARERNRPALLFERIKGDTTNTRILSNAMGSIWQLAFTLGLECGPTAHPLDLVQAWRQRVGHLRWAEPVRVETAPLFENVLTDSAIAVTAFPTPSWHDRDGGRYIGTGSAVITRDHDTGQVNVGTYRVMVVDDTTVTVWMEAIRDGTRHLQSWFRQGKSCPIAVVVGMDLPMFIAASLRIPPDCPDEYWFAGAIKDEPVALVEGPYTGLPLPATAELVLEGECVEGDLAMEGPFGEWPGYYVSRRAPSQAIRVKTVLYRHEPIILGRPPIRPPSSQALIRNVFRSAVSWNEMERAGLSGLRGVWYHEAGGDGFLRVLSIRQEYEGHGIQAAQLLLHTRNGLQNGKYVIVVDDDVDPTDLGEVMWAVTTRTDPASALHLVNGLATISLDPANRPGQTTMARLIVDACRPFSRRADSPETLDVPSREAIAALQAKWPQLATWYGST